MALITEDGTGRSDAESFASVADADTYFGNRGITNWSSLVTAEKEQALRRATDYMVQAYRFRWSGCRVRDTQALDWPRYLVPRLDVGIGGTFSYYDSDVVPAEVARACCELAVRAAAGELAADLGPPVVREKVGPLETEYLPGARQSTKYLAVEMLLKPFFNGGPNSMKVSRA
jgi:hypothetical protein